MNVKGFYQSIAVLMIAYLMIAILCIFSLLSSAEYNWWFAVGALILWIVSLVPGIIIIKKLFGGWKDENG